MRYNVEQDGSGNFGRIANTGLCDLDGLFCEPFGDGSPTALDAEHAERLVESGDQPVNVVLIKRLVLQQSMDRHTYAPAARPLIVYRRPRHKRENNVEEGGEKLSACCA
jgi:hypothetical protein